MPGFHVHHQLSELVQTQVHQVSDAIQLAHPLSSPSPLAFNLSQHQSLNCYLLTNYSISSILYVSKAIFFLKLVFAPSVF